jgi:hypothetical protein
LSGCPLDGAAGEGRIPTPAPSTGGVAGVAGEAGRPRVSLLPPKPSMRLARRVKESERVSPLPPLGESGRVPEPIRGITGLDERAACGGLAWRGPIAAVSLPNLVASVILRS